MPAKARKRTSPLEIAEQWTLVLARALEQPTLDEEGRVCFKTRALLPGHGEPVSKCPPKAGLDVYYCPDVVRITRRVLEWIREARRS